MPAAQRRPSPRLLLPRRTLGALGVVVTLVLVGCGQDESTALGSAPDNDETDGMTGTVLLYTSYNQGEVDAVLAAYAVAEPGVEVELFRAPTGQLGARIAAELRSGGIQGDVLLLSDPLSMQQYAADGQLREWAPEEADVVPAELRSETFWAVTTSHLVVVHAPGAAPGTWADLAGPDFRDAVAFPDPTFAGSAFGALGYFALADGYGLDYYERLEANGAVQVQAPGDVVAGVAEGRFTAGLTLDFLARDAIADGSPLEMAAPGPGAIQLYAPVAVFEATSDPETAESFANFLLTTPAQRALADQDRHPVREGVDSPPTPEQVVVPDWPEVFDRQEELRTAYREIFGG